MGPLALAGLAAMAVGEGVNTAGQEQVASAQKKIAGENTNAQEGYRSAALGQIQNVANQINNTGSQNTANTNSYKTALTQALESAAPQATPAGTTNTAGQGGTSGVPAVPGASKQYAAATKNANTTVNDYVNSLLNSQAAVGGIQRTAAEQGIGAQTAGTNIGVLQQEAGTTNLGNELAMGDITMNPWAKLGSQILMQGGGAAATAGLLPGAGGVGVATPYDQVLTNGFTQAGTAAAAGGTDITPWLLWSQQAANAAPAFA